ncbi:hypothetical protein [Hyphococcus sp.]|jgi:hypothetical protein|uniref:hypothetical protein n=1 Tax=Hyphococcus sp. TaxID=2038636 RepID=UPI003D0D6DBE
MSDYRLAMLSITVQEQVGENIRSPKDAENLDSIIVFRSGWKSSIYSILDDACANDKGNYKITVSDPNAPLRYKSLTEPQACNDLGVSAQAIFTCLATGGAAGFLVILERSLDKLLKWKQAREGRKITIKVGEVETSLEGDYSIKEAEKLFRFAHKKAPPDDKNAA